MNVSSEYTSSRAPAVSDIRQFFDSAYEAFDRYWWREPERYSIDPDDFRHSLLTREALLRLKGRSPGRALDLGAGEGADAIRLARLGYEVDAVEVSEVGCQKIEDFARKANVSVRIINEDAEFFGGADQYDVVISNGLLHYVQDKQRLIMRSKAMTSPGGLHVVSCFSDFTPVPAVTRSFPSYQTRKEGKSQPPTRTGSTAFGFRGGLVRRVIRGSRTMSTASSSS